MVGTNAIVVAGRLARPSVGDVTVILVGVRVMVRVRVRVRVRVCRSTYHLPTGVWVGCRGGSWGLLDGWMVLVGLCVVVRW